VAHTPSPTAEPGDRPERQGSRSSGSGGEGHQKARLTQTRPPLPAVPTFPSFAPVRATRERSIDRRPRRQTRATQGVAVAAGVCSSGAVRAAFTQVTPVPLELQHAHGDVDIWSPVTRASVRKQLRREGQSAPTIIYTIGEWFGGRRTMPFEEWHHLQQMGAQSGE